MIYLASPYSHENPRTQEERFHLVCIAAAALARQGHNIYSPIMHWHPIDAALGGDFLTHARYLEMDCEMIDLSEVVWVYCIPGFDTSKGVQREIEYANSKFIAVQYFRMGANGQPEFITEKEAAQYAAVNA